MFHNPFPCPQLRRKCRWAHADRQKEQREVEPKVELQLEAVASVCVCVCVFARSQVEENTGESIKRHLRILLAM